MVWIRSTKSEIIKKYYILKVVKILDFPVNYIIYFNIKVICPKVIMSPNLLLNALAQRNYKMSLAKL